MVRGRFRGIRREDRHCLVCDSGQVETEEHFLDVCEGISSARQRMWKKVQGCMRGHGTRWMKLLDMSHSHKTDWILGSEHRRGEWKWEELQRVILHGVKDMFYGRNRTGCVA